MSNEEERKTVVVKVTMPISVANEFIEETKMNYGDCRWFKIKFDDMMYHALLKNQPEEIKEEIQRVRDELISIMKSLYTNKG